MKRWGSRVSRVASLVTMLLLLASIAFSQEKDLSINAQTMNYSDSGNYVEALGSVEVAYKDLTAYGEKVLYFSKDRRITSDRTFELNYQGLTFEGKKLDFQMVDRNGSAEGVTVRFKNVSLFGKYVVMDKEKIELTDATFTTCNFLSPHYHFTANKIILYPEDGWLIGYWAVFYLDSVPTVPVPLYVYDLRAEEKGIVSSVPYPQFSSNNLDGIIISQSFPWNISRKLNGNVNVTYATKKYLGGGFDLKYELNSQNNGTFMLSENSLDPITMVYMHNYSFGKEITKPRSFDFQLFSLQGLQQFELKTKLSLYERINVEHVSMLPYLALNLKKATLQNIDFEGNVAGGFVTEESTGAGMAVVNAKLKAAVPLWDGWAGVLTPNLKADTSFYGNNTHWLKATGGLDLIKTWSPALKTNLGINHFFSNRGTSPYRYELYHFTSSDQINAGFLQSIGSSKFGINVLYNLPRFNPEEIDYIMRLGIHCFDIVFTYRATRGEFNFGLGID